MPNIELTADEREMYDDMVDADPGHDVQQLIAVLSFRPLPEGTIWETVTRSGHEQVQYMFKHDGAKYGQAVQTNARMSPERARQVLETGCQNTHAHLLAKAAHPEEYEAMIAARCHRAPAPI